MSPASKPIRVALLGAGIFAKQSHLPAILAAPSLSLVAVYSRSYSSASSLASIDGAPSSLDIYSDDSSASSKGSLDDLLARNDIDLVILALPIMHQPQVVRKAWQAGKGVISEKPVASTVQEATGLIELYEKEYKGKGIGWIIAEQFPYEASFSHARQLVADGAIGAIKAFKLDFFAFVEEDSKYNKTEWRRKPEYQGGYLQDGGVHFLAGLRTVLSSQSINIASISSFASSIQPHLPPFDALSGVVTTDSPGVAGTIIISFGIQGYEKKECTFIGEKGTIVVDFNGPVHFVRLSRPGAEDDDEAKDFPSEGVKEEFAAFAEAFQKGIGSQEWLEVEKKSGPKATLRDLAIIEAGLKSRGTPVSLENLGGQENWQL